ncbi:unnamed protein product [Dovyalis caffra]|uniref:Uncharacterized protein n=1 Tax=Dovyalis caffra TaxID=77055 RepID=A0AAV1S0L9_9ROSI|nr:unnamed protein product [Dovyalis caffra]
MVVVVKVTIGGDGEGLASVSQLKEVKGSGCCRKGGLMGVVAMDLGVMDHEVNFEMLESRASKDDSMMGGDR